LLRHAGIDFSWEEHVTIPVWSKFIFIAAYGLVTATYGTTLGETWKDPELADLTKSIMREIELIAKGLGIALPAAIVDEAFLKAGQFPFETKTSLQRDIESKGHMNEADLFGGTLIRYGEKLELPIPHIKTTYEKLLGHDPNYSKLLSPLRLR
jgi:2-dehydropantoate 2-reductase